MGANAQLLIFFSFLSLSHNKIIKWGIKEADRYQNFYKLKPNINSVFTCLTHASPYETAQGFQTLRRLQ